jgi:TRAP transporter 4TM/12TM fusion protein
MAETKSETQSETKSETKDGRRGLSPHEIQDLVIESDTGSRNPKNRYVAFMLIAIAFTWSLFQIYIASPFSLMGAIKLDAVKSRYVHLAFAIFLAFLAYPCFRRSPRGYIPLFDWLLALLATWSVIYLFAFYEQLAQRSGLIQSYILSYLNEKFQFSNMPIKKGWDFEMALIGVLLLLEATRRVLGLPLLVVASICLFYSLFGSAFICTKYEMELGEKICAGGFHLFPEILRMESKSFARVASQQWLSTEGVFGIALGVSTSFVFLFVLFGALLDKGGAGNYFIKVAFALLGHLRGGPAKAAVLASGMTGLISGSSIANTVTTGTFTIPLMRRVGFTGEKAGAVEVSSSVNGQIMPPVMGAAAFLMVAYTNIPYIQVIKHAFLPAIASYMALLYIVHLEAVKSNMKAIERPSSVSALRIRLLRSGIIMSSIFIIAGAVYFFVELVKSLFNGFGTFSGGGSFGDGSGGNGDAGGGNAGGNGGDIVGAGISEGILPSILQYPLFAILLFGAYFFLLKFASKLPDLKPDDPTDDGIKLPEVKPTVISGLHYLLPIVILVWFLMIERKSASVAAFWAVISMMFILLTQKSLKNFFRRRGNFLAGIKEGLFDIADGMVMGARNMIAIGIATATAGIIVGTVSLTGIGQVMAEVIETISGGSLFLILFFTGLISIILGMGLPTTANYIVVSSLMVPVVKELGALNGLYVELIAIHLFVFYFGIMADVTPPVGLASFAAAAISGTDPIRTGVQAFIYSLRTAILPFFFIFNTEILLIGVESLAHALFVCLYTIVGVLIFSAATQGFFLVKNKLYETIALFFISLSLLAPQILMNMFFTSYEEANSASLTGVHQTLGELPSGRLAKIYAVGFDEELEETVTVEAMIAGTKKASKNDMGEGKGDATNATSEYASYYASGDLSGDLSGDPSGDAMNYAGASQTKREDQKRGRDILRSYGLYLEEIGGELIVVDIGNIAEKAGFFYDYKITKLEVAQKNIHKYFMFIPAVILLLLIIMAQTVRKRRYETLNKMQAENNF